MTLRWAAISVWIVLPITWLLVTPINQAPFLIASPVIQAHVVVSLAALWLGGVLLLWPKGRPLHRRGGWVWAGLLAFAAASSLFITTVRPGHWSNVHGLSAVTLIALPIAVWAARGHRVKTHRAIIYGLFVVALLSELASAFLPGRMFHAMFVL